jgi:hypothetical protein
MGVDVSHLVLVALGDTSDEVGNQRLDSSQRSNVLAVTVVDGETNLTVADLGESHIIMTEVLGESTTRTGDGDNAGLDRDRDALGDLKDLVSLNVLHCWRYVWMVGQKRWWRSLDIPRVAAKHSMPRITVGLCDSYFHFGMI